MTKPRRCSKRTARRMRVGSSTKLRLCNTRMRRSLQVALAAVEIQQLAVALAIQADGHGVDGKIAAIEVLLDRAALHLGSTVGRS